MPDPTVPTDRLVSLQVSLHASTVASVDLADLSSSGDRFVSLTLGDADVGVNIVGKLGDVHRLIIEADRQLAHLATSGRRSTDDR